MPLIDLSGFREKHPSERDTVDRLQSLLNQVQEDDKRVFDSPRLAELAKPSSALSFDLLLGELVAAGILESFVRVQSPTTGAGIGDYPSLKLVPPKILDRTAEQEIEPTIKDVQFFFRKSEP